MRTCRCSFGQQVAPIVRTRAIAATTAFPLAVPDRRMPCGRTRDPYEAVANIKEHLAFYPSGSRCDRSDRLSAFSRSTSRSTIQAGGRHGGPAIVRNFPGVHVISNQPLLTPYRMGDLDLPNRIVMAPLTRMRAQPLDHVPTTLQAAYYAQRASAGLIISEATAISPEGFGWADTPGLWTNEQVRGWRHVTDAVHAAGGRIIAQLWHTGAMSHPELRDGAEPVSASDVDPAQVSVTRTGRKPTVTPRPLQSRKFKSRLPTSDGLRATRWWPASTVYRSLPTTST